MSAAGTPVISSARSGVNSCTNSRNSSKPSVCFAMNSRFSSPSRRITFAMALRSAVSVPMWSGRCRVAQRVSSIFRGSATMSFAPLRTASFTLIDRTGCVSVVLVPTAKISLASASSATLFVIAPRPTMTARPATEGACQVRAQLSTLLVPITARVNFWKR